MAGKEVYLDADVSIPPSGATAVTAIQLPAGTYELLGKTSMVMTAGKGTNGLEFRCWINSANGAAAADDVAVGEFSKDVGQQTLNMQTTATFASSTTVVLRCAVDSNMTGSQAMVARETKIIATPLASTNRVAGVAGASGS
jgi:hypothetical protein